MSPEINNQLEISEMRKNVHLWMKLRPTIVHTRMSLLYLIYGEIDELKKATSNEEIILETGDVFFSVCALDDRNYSDQALGHTDIKNGQEIKRLDGIVNKIGKNSRRFGDSKPIGQKLLSVDYNHIDESYAVINAICQNNGTTLQNVFNATETKNKIHYPTTFFDITTPFLNPADAMNCLRLFRKKFGNPESLNDFWTDLDLYTHGNTPFFDLYYAIGKFRSFIKQALLSIQKTQNYKDVLVNNLIKSGDWTMKPLIFMHENEK